MLSFLLSTCLFAGTSHHFSAATLQKEANTLGNRIRGRVLASFVKKGMRSEAACDILGSPEIVRGTLHSKMYIHSRLGVTVCYIVEHIEIAGEKRPESVWIVSEVIVDPIFDFFPRKTH